MTPLPHPRRALPCLRRLTVGCLAGLLACLASGAARAGEPEPERRERVESLHAHRMLFDRSGEPMVTVGLAEHVTRVEVRTYVPVSLLPEGEEAFRITVPADTPITLEMHDTRQARRRHWLVAERFTASGFDAATSARARLDAAGLRTGVFESGALTGLGGRLFDTRTITLAVSPGDSPAAARAGLARARGAGFIGGEPFVEVLERAGGLIVARFPGDYEVRGRDLMWLRPEGDALTEIRIPGDPLKQYAGELYVTLGGDGRLVLANLASAETLLESVVPSETFPNAPTEALKAQAVAARGQFLAKLGLKHRGDPFMLCNRWHCQAHGGQGRATSATTAAVRATRGEVLATPRGGLVDTVYHSACGGQTEGWDQSWGGEGRVGLGGVDDRVGAGDRPATPGAAESILADAVGEAWCAASGRRGGVYRWTNRIDGAALSRNANRLRAVGPVSELRVTRRGRSGRVLTLEVVGANGRHVVDGESAIRRLLGGLKSAYFALEREGGRPDGEPARWVVRGGGYGHGIGLCQHGAIGMAHAAHGYRAILQHYYPGTRLEKVW